MAGSGTAIILIAAIIFGSITGIILPETASTLSASLDYTILLLVFLLLFEVRIQDVVASINQTGFLIAALVANFIIIPALGYGIASLFLSAHPLFCMGLIIYFMAPCTDWFLGFTRLAKGNTALGTALLPINMIIQILLYPVYLHIFDINAADIGAGNILDSLWQWFCLPLIAAVALRIALEKLSKANHFENIQSIVSIIIPILLAVLVGQISAANIETLTSHLTICLLYTSDAADD